MATLSPLELSYFGFDSAVDVPAEERGDDLGLVISKKFVDSLEYSGSKDAANFYEQFHIAGSSKPKKVFTQLKLGRNEMSKMDHAVAEQIYDALDPKLRSVLLSEFFPRTLDDLDDHGNEANLARAEFLSLFRDDFLSPRWNGQDIVYSPEDGKTFIDSSMVVQSKNKVDHLHYVLHHYPSMFVSLYRQMSVLCSAKDFEVWTKDNCVKMLAEARALRNISKSLNKYTKVSQLDALDHDHPFFWFDEIIPEQGQEVIVVGDLDLRSVLRFEKVTFVDPSEVDYSWRGKIILANILRGDSVNGYSNNDKLLSVLEGLSEDDNNFVSCVAVPHLLKNFELLRKPRPHNLMAVVWLNSDCPSSVDVLVEQVGEANQARNDRYWKTVKPALLEPYQTYDQILRQVGSSDHVPPPKDTSRKRTSRPSRYERRAEYINRLVTDAGLVVDDERWCQLGLPLSEGPLRYCIPDYGDPEFVVSSVVNEVKRHHLYKLEFMQGQWHVCRKKKE